jgi:FMN phosphatase YigB (HAD superfamily)
MNTILFDLDGTLLPLDIDSFMNIYFHEMGKAFIDLIDGKELVSHIWASTNVMIQNKDYKTNEEIFMDDFKNRISGDVEIYKERFEKFYDTGFLKTKNAVKSIPSMKKSVELLKEKGYRVAVATNPLFPMKAIEHRINWAGFSSSDFAYVSSYEKNHYCKPQIEYYEEILQSIGAKPEECLMVGNDVQEDLVAGNLGIKTYLIKDYVLHRTEDEINADHIGNYDDFYRFVEDLPKISEQAV